MNDKRIDGDDGKFSKYTPNTSQMPNVFVEHDGDGLLRYMTGTQAKLLMIFTREIMGWEQHRATRKCRISTARFCELGGLSKESVISNLESLVRANVCAKVGEVTNDGNEWELNIGQLGDYKWDIITASVKKSGNPDPSPARLAVKNKIDQPTPKNESEELPPQVGGEGVYPLDTLEGEKIGRVSNQLVIGCLMDRQQGVYLIDNLEDEQGDNSSAGKGDSRGDKSVKQRNKKILHSFNRDDLSLATTFPGSTMTADSLWNMIVSQFSFDRSILTTILMSDFKMLGYGNVLVGGSVLEVVVISYQKNYGNEIHLRRLFGSIVRVFDTFNVSKSINVLFADLTPEKSQP